MIEPFEPGQVKAVGGRSIVSYGTSSSGYDARCADEFKLFTNINSTIVDPKAIDPNSFFEVKGDSCIIPPNSFALARTVGIFPYSAQCTDDQIWFKPHTKRSEYVFTKTGKYLATDLWNLFDGICFGEKNPIFLQMKTNSWAKDEPLRKFAIKMNSNVLPFNVTNKLHECKGHYKVFVRHYP